MIMIESNMVLFEMEILLVEINEDYSFSIHYLSIVFAEAVVTNKRFDVRILKREAPFT